MSKISNEKISKVAMNLVLKRNPYCARPYSVPFFIDKTPMFLYHGEICPQSKLDSDYLATCVKDITAGYRERKSGYYDKWYRYTRADEGAAYDAGVRLATNEADCPEEFLMIEIAKENMM